MTKLLTVHVRVNDAATGRPTPVRIRFTDAAGTYYAPFGRLTKFPTGRGEDVGGNVLWEGKEYAYIDGTCEIQLPPGLLHVEIHKGPEYEAIDTDVPLGVGQIALRFTIARRFDLRAEGWYSGDTRAHFLSPHAALLEGQAEDLAFVNLLAHEERQGEQVSYPNLLAFSGQTPALERDGTAVIVNTLNYHPVLGALALLNCHRIVFPLSSGGPEGDYWLLEDWGGQCHRKGGLAIWCPTFSRMHGRLLQGEALASAILGHIDACELVHGFWDEMVHHVLNAGGRIPVVGASRKCSNIEVVGSPRTYARLREGEQPTYQSWIEAVRAGRTFATRGPLLGFSLNGQEPGACVSLAADDQELRARLHVRNPRPGDEIGVIANGELVGEWTSCTDGTALDLSLLLPDGGWVAGVCRASSNIEARTSQVYVQPRGKRNFAMSDAVAWLDNVLTEGLAWVEREARCPTEQQRQHFRDTFMSAQQALRHRTEAT